MKKVQLKLDHYQENKNLLGSPLHRNAGSSVRAWLHHRATTVTEAAAFPTMAALTLERASDSPGVCKVQVAGLCRHSV